MDGYRFTDGLFAEPARLETYGYAPVLVVNVGLQDGYTVSWCDTEAMMRRDMSYAALRDDGLPLVVGGSRTSLWNRWKSILDVIEGENAWRLGREMGALDPGCWARAVRGREFQVWARKALATGDHALLEQDVCALSMMLRPALGVSQAQQHSANWGWAPEQNSFLS